MLRRADARLPKRVAWVAKPSVALDWSTLQRGEGSSLAAQALAQRAAGRVLRGCDKSNGLRKECKNNVSLYAWLK